MERFVLSALSYTLAIKACCNPTLPPALSTQTDTVSAVADSHEPDTMSGSLPKITAPDASSTVRPVKDVSGGVWWENEKDSLGSGDDGGKKAWENEQIPRSATAQQTTKHRSPLPRPRIPQEKDDGIRWVSVSGGRKESPLREDVVDEGFAETAEAAKKVKARVEVEEVGKGNRRRSQPSGSPTRREDGNVVDAEKGAEDEAWRRSMPTRSGSVVAEGVVGTGDTDPVSGSYGEEDASTSSVTPTVTGLGERERMPSSARAPGTVEIPGTMKAAASVTRNESDSLPISVSPTQPKGSSTPADAAVVSGKSPPRERIPIMIDSVEATAGRGEGVEWERACALLSDMEVAGIRPPVDAYQSVMRACVGAGRVGEALEVAQVCLAVCLACVPLTFFTR